MSVQNALKLIQKLRKDNQTELASITTLAELAKLSEKHELSCSSEELRTAFQIDWKMRWMKASQFLESTNL